MTFDELLNLVSSKNAQGRLWVCADSRLVKKGDIFVAIKGTVHDGHSFIPDAIEKGAKYIVCQRTSSIQYRLPSDLSVVALAKTEALREGGNIEIIIVDDSAKALALLAQAGFGNPSKKLINLAVTGTNGKTTVAFLVRSIIHRAGCKCPLVGTIFYDTGSGTIDAAMTTPDAPAIARLSAEAAKSGAKYMMVEASSHALDQERLAGVDFKAAAFTNLSGDHLDYHKDMESYLAAKAKLFESLPSDAVAVLNKQSPQAERIARATKAKKLWYAVDEPADITAHIESMDINGTVFVLEYLGQSSIVNRQSSIVKTPLLGRHNVSNHLAAAGLALAAGFDPQTIAAGLASLDSVPGRLEPVNCGQDFLVLIDYAHTDDALKNVLTTIRPLCKASLTVVFGCGGDRDRTKRPRMARVAEQLADIVIVTSDNPRTERPEDIISEIVAGFEKGPCVQSSEIRNTKIIEPDRKKAIELAIKTAAKDDIVLIAGKGHEAYQIIGKEKFAFSDKTTTQECLEKRIRNKEKELEPD